MSLFGKIFGGKGQRQEDEFKYKLKMEMKEDRDKEKYHADEVAYQNKMQPINRAAGVLNGVANVVGAAGSAIAAFEGGGATSSLGGLLGGGKGQPGQPGGAPVVGGALTTGGNPLSSLTKNPMMLVLIGVAALFVLKPSRR